ncbi:MAG: glycosyltransferase family 9 protein [Oscillochloris sp.]|nr:glycosyltransferase family 9 protein [Oscillochloris sp.]
MYIPLHNRSHVIGYQPPVTNICRIAIMRALSLGDLLITTPAWRALRQHFPQAEITLIGLPWAAQFLTHVPDLINRLVIFPGYPGITETPYEPERTARFFEEQQAYDYDLAIQMHGDDPASNSFISALGARKTVGFTRSSEHNLHTVLPSWPEQHEVLRWMQLAAAAGAPADSAQIEFQLSAHDRARAKKLLCQGNPDGRLIGLHIGAKALTRRWPVSCFAALGQELHRLTGARIVLTGTSAEHSLSILMSKQFGRPVINLTGRTTLGDLGAVISELDLLVTNDTSASHLAAAMGTPSVVLFGPTRPACYAPLDTTLHHAIDALDYVADAINGAEALVYLPVEPVLEAALAQLANQRTLTTRLLEREIGG